MQRVLDQFPAVPASRAIDGALQKLVGRVVVAGQQPFFSPATGKPCVYFHLVVEEECVHVAYDERLCHPVSPAHLQIYG